MPIYEYECRCGNAFELVRPISDRHSVTCACGELALLQMSGLGRILIAGWDTVVDCDGRVVSRKQSTKHTAMVPERVHGSRF